MDENQAMNWDEWFYLNEAFQLVKRFHTLFSKNS